MGGRGSGRTGGLGMLSDKCHEYRSIDLSWLRRKKLLNVGRWSTLTWSRSGQVTGSIRIECLPRGVKLIYRQRRNGEDWQDINEFVPLVDTPTPFGGSRQWFQCLSCGSRCRILYGGSHFRCRRCHRLKYDSQYEPAYARAASMAHNIRKKLGYIGSLDDPFPLKPKGMHWQTYRRLEARDAHCQQEWAVGVMAWIRKIDEPKR